MKNSLKWTLIAIVALLIFGACSKKAETETATTVQITVSGTTSGIATVNLYTDMTAVNSNTPKYMQTTDANNQATITVDYASKYYVVVTKGSAKNYYAGYIPIAIFQTQAQIQASPIQTPAAVIGGVKFQDTNGDGIITVLDKTDAPTINITQSVSNSQTITVY